MTQTSFTGNNDALAREGWPANISSMSLSGYNYHDVVTVEMKTSIKCPRCSSTSYRTLKTSGNCYVTDTAYSRYGCRDCMLIFEGKTY